MQKQLRERKEEILMFERFKNVATSKLEAMTVQSEQAGTKYQLGEYEKKVLRQMNGMGIKEGIAAGIVTFFVLRRGPIYVARWVYKRRLAQRQSNAHIGGDVTSTGTVQQQPPLSTTMKPPISEGGYQLSNPNIAATKNPFQIARNPDFPRSKNFFIRSIWFAFDTVLSLMMAASVSMAYTDTDKIRQDLIELPLVPGRSLTADALCDEIVAELQKVREEDLSAYRRLTKLNSIGKKTPASFYLEGIIGFSENCQRRRYAERHLRQERGLPSNHPVEISESISNNAPRLVFGANGIEKTVHSSDISSSSFFDDESFEGANWASEYVNDMEDHRESKGSKRR